MPRAVTWQNNFVEQQVGVDDLNRGVFGGPVVLLDGGDAVVFGSTADHAKHWATYQNGSSWALGPSSELLELPANFSFRTVVARADGVTAAVKKYGDWVLRDAETDRAAALAADVVVNGLGYWTDNGAVYYGDAWKHDLAVMAAPHATMEAAAVAVAAALRRDGVALAYWQWDDWWYPGEAVYVDCVDAWTMLPAAFPSGGLADMRRRLGVPFLLYMPYVCRNASGFANWTFLTPDDCGWDCEGTLVDARESEAFHGALFENYGEATSDRGLVAYEQDFMVTNFLKTRKYRQVLGEYERWFAGMAAAAADREIPLQLCMAMPSDAILAAKADWATNARASDDYALPSNLPSFGGGALLLWALGLRPSKDTFWTTSNSSKRAYAPGANPGTNVELNAIVAATSTGPVGIGDAAGETDAALVARTCAADGALLQPAKPLTPLDRTYAASWRGGEAWGSHVVSGSAAAYLTLAFSVDATSTLAAADFYPAAAARDWVHRAWHAAPCADGADALASGCVVAAFPQLGPSTDRGGGRPYDYWLSYPADGETWLLLGELDKFVPLAGRRFAKVANTGARLDVALRGSPGEVVAVTALERNGGGWTARVREVTFETGDAALAFGS